jgi:light-regulated signal transduction histidine kinase (bacteriophytochrome)
MTIDDATLQRLALQCENEDLRRCGTILPHGVLLRVDARDQSITHTSDNVESLLGKTVSQLLGRPFLECGLPIVLSHDDQRRQPGARTEYAALDAGGQGKLDAVVTVVEAGWLIECWAARADTIDKVMLARYQKELSVTILDEAEIVTLANVVARAFVDIAGFTRAMVYRFQASDIPKVARNLYLLKAYRQLPNPIASFATLTDTE